jgi:hypothetical protein
MKLDKRIDKMHNEEANSVYSMYIAIIQGAA